MNTKDDKLLKVINRVIFYQIFYLVFPLFMIMFLYDIFSTVFFLLLFMLVVFFHTLYIMAIYIFAENLCPNCNKPFFKLNSDDLFNMGNALRSRKCVHCNYKLKKENNLSEDETDDKA